MRQLAALCFASLLAVGLPTVGEAHFHGGGPRGGFGGGFAGGGFGGGGFGGGFGGHHFHEGGFGRFRPRPWQPGGPPPPGMPAPPPGRAPDEFSPNGAPSPHPWRDGPQSRFDREHIAPLDPVLENLQHRSPGRQLNTVIENEDGRPVYRVRWMTNEGQRIDYVVDATTGRFLGKR